MCYHVLRLFVLNTTHTLYKNKNSFNHSRALRQCNYTALECIEIGDKRRRIFVDKWNAFACFLLLPCVVLTETQNGEDWERRRACGVAGFKWFNVGSDDWYCFMNFQFGFILFYATTVALFLRYFFHLFSIIFWNKECEQTMCLQTVKVNISFFFGVDFCSGNCFLPPSRITFDCNHITELVYMLPSFKTRLLLRGRRIISCVRRNYFCFRDKCMTLADWLLCWWQNKKTMLSKAFSFQNTWGISVGHNENSHKSW